MRSCFLTFDLECFSAYKARSLGLPAARSTDATRRGVERFLELLERFAKGARCTVFTTAELASNAPEIVRLFLERGHEIGCHSFEHESFLKLDGARFRELLHRATSILEDVTGAPVRGFRAPSFSLSKDMGWAFECLIERGYLFDSSLLRYSARSAATSFDTIETPCGNISEFPLRAFRYGSGVHIRALGGTYFRVLPLSMIERILLRVEHDGFSPILFLHAQDLDASEPSLGFRETMDASLVAAARWPIDRLVERVGSESIGDKLERVLSRRPVAGTMSSALELAGAFGEAPGRAGAGRPSTP